MEAFAPYSPISCNVLTNMYGRSRGFAIVKFNYENDANRAIDSMSGFAIMGRPIEVEPLVH